MTFTFGTKKVVGLVAVGIAVSIACILSLVVYANYYTGWMIIFWVVGLGLLLIEVSVSIDVFQNKWWLVALGIAFVPVWVRCILYSPERIHGDDMLTAYFSDHYQWRKDNFFGAVPPLRTDWVSQFPSVYFAGQKLLFSVTGIGLPQVFMSTLPYVYLIGMGLFLLAAGMLSLRVGLITVWLYAFFPPSLYMETIGLQFTMTAAIYCVFLAGCWAYWRTLRVGWSLIIGITTGFGYLAYTSGYISLPLMMFFYLLVGWVRKTDRMKIFLAFLFSLVGFFVTWAPFGAYLVHNNYLVQRTDQVALIGGLWAEKLPESSGLREQGARLLHQTLRSLEGVFRDGVLGHGGYNFGYQRFLQPFALSLVVVGLVSVGLEIFKRRKYFWFVILVSILGSFGAIVFSIPPPAYHRFSLAFPLVVLVMGAGLGQLFRFRNTWVMGMVIIVVLGGYTWESVTAYQRMLNKELPNETVTLVNALQSWCSDVDRKWYMAAYPGFSLEKVLYVMEGNTHHKITTDYHLGLLHTLNKSDKYCYVILYPQEFDRKFALLDEAGKIYPLTEGFSLFKN